MHPVFPDAGEGSSIGVGHDTEAGPLVLHVIPFVGGTVGPGVNAQSMELPFHKLRKKSS